MREVKGCGFDRGRSTNFYGAPLQSVVCMPFPRKPVLAALFRHFAVYFMFIYPVTGCNRRDLKRRTIEQARVRSHPHTHTASFIVMFVPLFFIDC